MFNAEKAREITEENVVKKQEADFKKFKPIVEKAIMDSIKHGEFSRSMSGGVVGNKLIANWLKSLGYEVSF